MLGSMRTNASFFDPRLDHQNGVSVLTITDIRKKGVADRALRSSCRPYRSKGSVFLFSCPKPDHKNVVSVLNRIDIRKKGVAPLAPQGRFFASFLKV